MVLKLKLEYRCYPIWIYEGGKLLDNDLPQDTKEYNVINEMLCKLQEIFDSAFIDDGIKFEYIGLSKKKLSDIEELVDKIISKLGTQFEIENNVDLRKVGNILKFKENDSVRILRSKGENIKQGDLGVVIMVFDNPNQAYEIEVVDDNGNTKAIDTFLEDEIELI